MITIRERERRLSGPDTFGREMAVFVALSVVSGQRQAGAALMGYASKVTICRLTPPEGSD
ncbi:hypothetical protein AA0311_0641 [Asaia bogorensis NBRC 16594]|uniref:Uncharacterized protein n=1 Tax=Asaia bogorensis NBRC 16594 TaxID=1231624 RepID=A0AAN4U1R0_9PROT|nr:hypothetical protein Asbog_00116 [Asaia bogorensis NBRC 16594]GBQ74758.1 hypothetical protein AA0311_0641 [Asaia bogorensis NBRC 16594]GEL52784.1 hypothetical protein ABO01nite_07910 [Asaia bogorensis NBRC 16594]